MVLNLSTASCSTWSTCRLCSAMPVYSPLKGSPICTKSSSNSDLCRTWWVVMKIHALSQTRQSVRCIFLPMFQPTPENFWKEMQQRREANANATKKEGRQMQMQQTKKGGSPTSNLGSSSLTRSFTRATPSPLKTSKKTNLKLERYKLKQIRSSGTYLKEIKGRHKTIFHPKTLSPLLSSQPPQLLPKRHQPLVQR